MSVHGPGSPLKFHFGVSDSNAVDKGSLHAQVGDIECVVAKCSVDRIVRGFKEVLSMFDWKDFICIKNSHVP